MTQDIHTLKNVKDLQYNTVLNKQNIVLVFLGMFFISVFSATGTTLPTGLTKMHFLAFLVILSLVSVSHYKKKLKEIEKEILTL